MKTIVLYGGESSEREISLQSGACVAEALGAAGIASELFDWDPSKMDALLAEKDARVFVALHGGSGENGTVQALLTLAGIPFTGIRMRAAALCMDKFLSKMIVRGHGVPVPKCLTLPARQALQVLSQVHDWSTYVEALGFPLIVKPARNGSSVGVTLVETVDAMDEAVLHAVTEPDEIVMFEQYVEGYELTVAMLNGKALGVCQIVPKNKFYDYDAKYNRSDTEYLTPSSLGSEFDARLCRLAELSAQALDCMQGVVRIDFLADKDLNPYFLECNTVPGMTSHSLVPKIAAHAGISFPELCKRIVEMAE